MSDAVVEIAERLKLLSPAEKQEVMQLLLQDIDGPEQDADEAWQNEVVRRVKAIRNGEAAIQALKEWQD
ncbi:addiction module protein [Massilia sp. HP4]|uniref:addiction module protein n=1 Tax=Massilia sp. HP4 TaxID=2562316 RepID=UPI0010C095A5|nr:addiction module protein [Massilia sp. HP4]